MKSKEELEILKKEYQAMNKKFVKLTKEEIKQVTGGASNVNNIEIVTLEKGDTWRSFDDVLFYYLVPKRQTLPISEIVELECYTRGVSREGGFSYEGSKKMIVYKLLETCYFVGNGII